MSVVDVMLVLQVYENGELGIDGNIHDLRPVKYKNREKYMSKRK